MKKYYSKIALTALFVFCFLFFLYLSFPYGVLKEAISSQVQASTGIAVRIDELGPAFPFGLSAEKVDIVGAGGNKLTFKEVGVRLSLWQLLLMRLGVTLSVDAQPSGSLNVSLGFPIFGLFSKNGLMPSTVSLAAKSFPVDSAVSYGLKHVANSGAAGPLAGPLLGALGFRGNLNGKADVDLDSSSISQSKGDVDLDILNSALLLSDPSIGLPDQEFKTAKIKGSMAQGILKIEQVTKFVAEELELGIDGKINVKNAFAASDLDLKLGVKLSGGLGDKFGWLMEGLTGGESKGGVLVRQIRGTLGSPITSSL